MCYCENPRWWLFPVSDAVWGCCAVGGIIKIGRAVFLLATEQVSGSVAPRWRSVLAVCCLILSSFKKYSYLFLNTITCNFNFILWLYKKKKK